METITSARAEALAIGELSRLAGVHIETIRYYERVGMSPPPPRSAGGRRVYGQNHARILAFIRRARELGFTLEEIRTLLELNRAKPVSCAEVQKLAGLHLESVRSKLADLATLEYILAKTLAKCVSDVSPDCPVLDMLDQDVEVSVSFKQREQGVPTAA